MKFILPAPFHSTAVPAIRALMCKLRLHLAIFSSSLLFLSLLQFGSQRKSRRHKTPQGRAHSPSIGNVLPVLSLPWCISLSCLAWALERAFCSPGKSFPTSPIVRGRPDRGRRFPCGHGGGQGAGPGLRLRGLWPAGPRGPCAQLSIKALKIDTERLSQIAALALQEVSPLPERDRLKVCATCAAFAQQDIPELGNYSCKSSRLFLTCPPSYRIPPAFAPRKINQWFLCRDITANNGQSQTWDSHTAFVLDEVIEPGVGIHLSWDPVGFLCSGCWQPSNGTQPGQNPASPAAQRHHRLRESHFHNP